MIKHRLEIAKLIEAGVSCAKFPDKHGMMSWEFLLEGKFLNKDRKMIALAVLQGKQMGKNWVMRYCNHETLGEKMLHDAGLDGILTGDEGKGIKLKKALLDDVPQRK